MEDIFARVTFVSGQEIRDGLLASAISYKEAGFTVVSLERVYLDDPEIDGRIELTRSVNSWGEDILIPSPRNGTPARRIQLDCFRDKRVALIDDVVFSGQTLIGTIADLHHYRANVHAVTSAIGVKSGIDRLKAATFGVIGQPQHITIDCLEEFDGVSDQVCERDFYPGIPYSGREHMCGMGSLPYIHPFGLPNKWASIPEKETESFSLLCMENTIALFEEIERLNNTMVTCTMVPRPPVGTPKDKTSFVSFLKKKRAVCSHPDFPKV